jgi:hypothetical protein
MKRGVDRAGIVALITSLFGVGLIATVVLGAWLYVQQRDVGKSRALNDRETALIAGFKEQVNGPRPAEGVVATTGPSVILPRISDSATVGSLPQDRAAPEPVSQSAAITPVDAPGSVTSPRKPPPAAAEPVLQSITVTGSAAERAAHGTIARAAIRKCHAIAATPAASDPHCDAAAYSPSSCVASSA